MLHGSRSVTLYSVPLTSLLAFILGPQGDVSSYFRGVLKVRTPKAFGFTLKIILIFEGSLSLDRIKILCHCNHKISLLFFCIRDC